MRLHVRASLVVDFLGLRLVGLLAVSLTGVRRRGSNAAALKDIPMWV